MIYRAPPGMTAGRRTNVDGGIGPVPSSTNVDFGIGSVPPSATPHNAQQHDAIQVIPIEGKGFGVVAQRDIEASTRLLAERALVAIAPGSRPIDAAFMALAPPDRARVFGLSQNASRWPGPKSAEGIFGTNSIPMHAFADGFRGIFPTIARFNHSCEPNALYRWNARLQKLTVAACRRIVRGEEICVCYGFPSGFVTRSQRQAHLRANFGFDCTCSKCALAGDAQRRSDETLMRIGDSPELVNGLSREGYLAPPHLLTSEPSAEGGLLQRIDHIWSLVQRESRSSGSYLTFFGCDCLLKAFVDLLEGVSRRLAGFVQQCRQHAAARTPHPPLLPNGELCAMVGPQHVPLGVLESFAAQYMEAARSYAGLAAETHWVLDGPDSPAFEAWSRALRGSCWQPSRMPPAPESGQLPFFQRWLDAGLSPPLSPRSVEAVTQGNKDSLWVVEQRCERIMQERIAPHGGGRENAQGPVGVARLYGSPHLLVHPHVQHETTTPPEHLDLPPAGVRKVRGAGWR